KLTLNKITKQRIMIHQRHSEKTERSAKIAVTEPQPSRVHNLSLLTLEPEAVSMLQKVFNFAVAPKTVSILDIVAKETRVIAANILKQSSLPKYNIKTNDLKTLKELKNSAIVLIVSGDKGYATVILDRIECDRKI